MKRFLAMCTAATLLFVCCGCGAPAKSPQNEADAPNNEQLLPDSPPHTGTLPTPEGSDRAESGQPPEAHGESGGSTENGAAQAPGSEPGHDPIGLLLSSLTMEEKVGQLFFPRCPAEDAAEDVAAYHLGGWVLFGRDFKGKTAEEITRTLAAYQSAALADTGIPLLLGAAEEGGTVVRISSNPALRAEKFPSPQQLCADGGMEAVRADAAEKSALLKALGLNVNLAPVCDVSTDPADFIHDRAFGQPADATAEYVRETVTVMSDHGMGSVLKHFPGYGSNADTHTDTAVDSRPLEAFEASDLLPFAAGMAAGSGLTSVLVSHNVVSCMDPTLPASLSPAVHRYLREEMGFEGVVMTDDLAMEAAVVCAGDGSVAVMALQAGNDLLLTTDYRTQIPAVLAAVEDGTLDTALIDAACRRVLTWKQALGLL